MARRKTGWVADYLNTNPETIRRWSKEFEDYLSPSANPEQGATRFYTDEDIEVFALAHQMLIQEHGEYEQVRKALERGERGDPHIITAIVSDAEASREISLLQEQLRSLSAKYQQMVEFTEGLKEDMAKANQRAESAEGERDRVKQDLGDAQSEIARLNRELGKLEMLIELARKKDD